MGWQAGPTVHPCGCGEHSPQAIQSAVDAGSSPRVRGTRGAVAGDRQVLRFIPAGAGNMRRPSGRGSEPAVHPRRCGEHMNGRSSASLAGGSSPRVRGTRVECRRQELRARFIPAGAGNTCWSTRSPTPPTVHPRGCGEHEDPSACADASPGSSPRVRGTRVRRCQAALRRGFIPAGAGNTVRTVLRSFSRPVHPRGCGEHLDPTVPSGRINGSSPRVRGTRVRLMRGITRLRFIPAGAGNTG